MVILAMSYLRRTGGQQLATQTPDKHLTPRRLEQLSGAALFLVALAPRLAIALLPIPTQLVKTLTDDAFYYFLTAQHILRGAGPSVDGINPSNGWHPLWLLINLIVQALPLPSSDIYVHLALALSALFDSLVVIVLYHAARRYVSTEAATIGALIYALNAMPALQSVNGLETGLAALLIAAAWASTLRMIRTPSAGSALLWGLAFGLCFLARTDTALILLWLGLYGLLNLPQAARWRLVLLGAGVAIVLAAPWLVWNWLAFGSPLAQTSAAAVPWAIRARYTMAHPSEPLWRLSLQALAHPTTWLRGDYLGTPPLIGFLLWPLAALGLKDLRRPLPSTALLLLGGGVCLILVHTLLRYYPRPWYFVVMAQSLALGLALLWERTSPPSGLQPTAPSPNWRGGWGMRSQKRMRLRGVALTTLLAILLASGLAVWRVGYYPWQAIQLEAAQWIRQNTPPQAVIASMNSGIMGYYGGRATINLDGVVNPQAFAAIRTGRLLAYMQEVGVDYFIDSDYALESEYGPFMGADYRRNLHEVTTIGAPYPGLGYWRVYEVLPPER